jgi:acyl-CoA synthetase (AMP-forming)/AMP-acid ligase II
MEIPSKNFLWQYLAHWGRARPDDIALRFDEQSVTFRDLDERTDRLAEAFLDLGVEKGDRIATILPPRPEFVYSFVAANKIGAVTVPMDVRFRMADLTRHLKATEPRVLITANCAENNPIVETLETMVEHLGEVEIFTLEPAAVGRVFGGLLEMPSRTSQRLETAKAAQSPDDGALIIFTGGTTGEPKAALLSQRNVGAMCGVEAETFRRLLDAQGYTERPRVLANLPPSHVGGTVELIGAQLAAGWEVILMDRWSPHPVLEAVVREKVPFIGAVPTIYAILLALPDLDRYDLSSLRFVVLSGEKVSLELLQGIRSKICRNIVIGYGSTEAGAEITFTEPSDHIGLVASGYVGKPLSGVKIRIVDDEERPVRAGEVGEVLVAGPFTIRKYFRMPGEDERGFAADGFCRTGDLGYLTEDGGLFIKGRKKHIIRVGSYTVVPSEVEGVVLRHPRVATAAAVGVPDDIYGEVVWLFVVPTPDAAPNESELLDLCKRELADYKVPKRVLMRESLAASRVGKVDRARLQKEVLDLFKD